MKSFILLLSTITLLFSGHYSMAQASEDTQSLEDRPLQILKRVPPKYPILPLAKKTEGWVKVVFTITTEGDVTDVAVVDAQPRKVFDYAAVEAIRQFKFIAPIVDGQLIEQRASQVIEFDIPDQEIGKMAFFGGFLHNLNKAQGIVQHGLTVHEEVILLVKDIGIKSKIKTHKRTLNQLVLKVIPDQSGQPDSIEVVRDDFTEKGIDVGVSHLKERSLEGAKIAVGSPAGYYNPTFVYNMAKNLPPTVFGIMEAKSMPIPEYSHEMTLQAELTLNKKGRITEVKEANLDGEPVSDEFMDLILDTLVFMEAYKNFKPVEDTIDFSKVFSLVQKSDVERIRQAWLTSLNEQNKPQ